MALQASPLEFVLSHADMRAGNLLIGAECSGAEYSVYIVDWDNPALAPREQDLGLVGGCDIWNDPRQAALFYQGYGPAQIDPMALAYYRYERIIQDIALFASSFF